MVFKKLLCFVLFINTGLTFATSSSSEYNDNEETAVCSRRGATNTLPVPMLDVEKLQKEHSIFSKIAFNSMSGFDVVISDKESCKAARDSMGRTPLRATLEAMSLFSNTPRSYNVRTKMLRALLANGSIPEEDDIEYFLDNFFYKRNKSKDTRGNVQEFYLAKSNAAVYGSAELSYRASFILAKKLILAAINSEEKNLVEEEKKEKIFLNIDLVSKVMDFWCRRDAIASALSSLYENKKLMSVYAERFFQNYNYLFLQDELPSFDVIARILDKTKKLASNSARLLFLLDADIMKHSLSNNYKLMSVSMEEMIKERNTEKGINKTVAASTITSISNDFFANFSPVFIVRASKYLLDPSIENFLNHSQRLRLFVENTIKVSHDPNVKSSNYAYWLDVYKELFNEGNLNGAFDVAVGLVRSLEKKSDFSYGELNIGDPRNNYFAYEQYYAEQIEKEHLLPSFTVMFKNLKNLELYSLFLDEQETILNIELLEKYLEIRDYLQKAQRSSIKSEMEVRKNKSLMTLFYHPPTLKEHDFYLAYSSIMPMAKKIEDVQLREKTKKRFSLMIRRISKSL